MVRGDAFMIHRQNGKLMKGNHHHLEAKKFLVDRGKRKGYAGSLFDCQVIVRNEFTLEIKL
jgi:hypothetical protein